MHFEFLLTFLGVVFLLVLLLTPAAPGWFVWALPFLVVYQVFSGRRSALLVGGFGLLYVLTSFMSMEMPGVRGVSLSIAAFDDFRTLMSGRGVNLAHSALLAFGIALLWRLWKEAIVHHPGFRLDRKPLVIGIAGDSGAGKDALVDAMAAIFGSHSVVRLSGDDYHLWDRHKPMWQVMTHLNPRANDLAQFTTDLSSLINGRPILKRHYDHHVGRKSKPYRQHSNDIILVSGLHALYVPFLRDCYDLSIFLDIDETLRRYFKMRRDVHQRGHSADKVLASIERRRDDAQQFINPQAAQADLVLALQPVEEKDWGLDKLSPGSALPPLKLLVQTAHTALEEAMARVLIAYCGLRVDLSLSGDHAKVTLAIEGDCAGADIALAARQLLPQASELLDIAPQWRDGIAGIMQLIVFAHAYQALQRQRS